MQEIKTSREGIDYLHAVLNERPLTITKAAFWKIPHRHSGNEELALKIGRYKKKKGIFNMTFEELESLIPKSELTLTGDEFEGLINFLHDNYEPFKEGVKKYFPIEAAFEQDNIEHLKAIFSNPEKQELLNFIVAHEIIPQELFTAFNQLTKVKAVQEFESMLDDDLTEHHWQQWFQENDWVLGTEFVKILDERKIDTANISDFLMQAYDGFIDIVEIKRPEGNLRFWVEQKDHDNCIPHQDLVKAITQASKYISMVR